jgi:hypothetical protein
VNAGGPDQVQQHPAEPLIEPLTQQEARPMTDRIDPSTWPSPRGPWPEVDDLNRLYDHGRRWCVNAAGHPGEIGYPDPDRHLPWHECRGPEAWLHDARRDLDGEHLEVSVYVAAAFRFGQQRHLPLQSPTRLVIDAWAPTEGAVRVSLTLGETVRLARILNRLVDSVSLPNCAA